MRFDPLTDALRRHVRLLHPYTDGGIVIESTADDAGCVLTVFQQAFYPPHITTASPEQVLASLCTEVPASLFEGRIPASLHIDLTADGRTVGTVWLYRFTPPPPPQPNFPDLSLFAQMAADEIQQALAIKHLEQRLFFDPHTGARTFNWFLDHVEHEVETAKREAQPLTIGGADVRGFGGLNKEVGHFPCDNLMSELVRFMRRHLRGVDEIARFSNGDEFLLVLPNTPYENGLAFMRKLQELLQTHPFSVIDRNGEEQRIYLRLYVGAASFPQHGSTPSELAERAFYGLEEEKQNAA